MGDQLPRGSAKRVWAYADRERARGVNPTQAEMGGESQMRNSNGRVHCVKEEEKEAGMKAGRESWREEEEGKEEDGRRRRTTIRNLALME